MRVLAASDIGATELRAHNQVTAQRVTRHTDIGRSVLNA
jgi:hypothetical protein